VKHEVVPVTKADQRWILPYLLPVLNSKKKNLKKLLLFFKSVNENFQFLNCYGPIGGANL
jgi:hypothetical protein